MSDISSSSYSNDLFKRDSRFWWRPARVYYPAASFSGMIGAAGVGVGEYTGAPVEQEIGTIGYGGVLLDTAGDIIIHHAAIPADLDVNHPVYARVHWATGSTDTADSIVWTLLYLAVIPNVTALIVPATAMSKDGGTMDVPVATANVSLVTPWSRINGKTISPKAEIWVWSIALTSFDGGLTEDKVVSGLEIRYTPKRLHYGDGMRQEAASPRSMLNDDYSVV